MHVAPTTLEKLSFDRVIAALAERAATPLGRERALLVRPDLDDAARALAYERTEEVLLGDDPALGGVEDVRPLVERVRDGGVLDGREILSIAYTMDAAATVRRAIAAGDRPRLRALAEAMASFDGVLRLVREQLDTQGEVRDDATPKLREIRRRLQPLRGRIRERLAQLLAQHAAHVQDPIVTLRRDRYVIPIKASAQSRVPGIVVDTSDSGQTVFVEPAAVVPMNNELALLEFEERDEVRRILLALGQRVAFDPGLDPTLAALAELDLALASARLAREWRLTRPDVEEGAPVALPGARHPLVEGCVPNDLSLAGAAGEERLMVVTGPNAGGKTVLLKTLGLAVTMAHAGLFVAAGAERRADGRPRRVRLPRVASLLTDIGDEQSIEASLSTYAAHLTNLRRIVEAAGPDTLVLVDELGSGTDPRRGGRAVAGDPRGARGASRGGSGHHAPGAAQGVRVAHRGREQRRHAVRRRGARTDLRAGHRPARTLVRARHRAPHRARRAAAPARGGAARTRGGAPRAVARDARASARGAAARARRRPHSSDQARAEAELLRTQIERLREREAELLAQAAREGRRAPARHAAARHAAASDGARAARAARQDARGDPGVAARDAPEDAPAPGRRARARPCARRAAPGSGRAGRLVRGGGADRRDPRRHPGGAARPAQGGGAAPRGAPVAPKARRRALRRPGAATSAAAGFDRELNVGANGSRARSRRSGTSCARPTRCRCESVRILHGKGTGVLRDAVRQYLREERLVSKFEDAVPYEGRPRRDRGLPAREPARHRVRSRRHPGRLAPRHRRELPARLHGGRDRSAAEAVVRSEVGLPLEAMYERFAPQEAVAALAAAYRRHYPSTSRTVRGRTRACRSSWPSCARVATPWRWRPPSAATWRRASCRRWGWRARSTTSRAPTASPTSRRPTWCCGRCRPWAARVAGWWATRRTTWAPARRPGCAPSRVTWGTHDADRLRAAGADVVADDLAGLLGELEPERSALTR
jgi:DNA mismatch repair protein MutS2